MKRSTRMLGPAPGVLQRITLDYVLNPASGSVTTIKTLADFAMHW